MPIVALCSCGKRIGVADALAGRTISCPKCGEQVLVPEVSAPSAGAVAARKKQNAVPPISVNPFILMAGTVGMILLVIVLALYFGPWTVGKQWAAMSPKANTDVTDVVQFALQAYESQNGSYDVNLSHNVPMTQGDASFVPPYMAFSMPRHVPFIGKTNQGNYIGTYDTGTGEVAVDIETGGWTIGGLVDARKANGKFHVTGRMKDGAVTAEYNGQPLVMLPTKIHNKYNP